MIFLQNINYEVMKQKFLSAYNFINPVNISPHPSILIFIDSTIYQKTLLMDGITKSALLINKSDLSLFVDPDFDISEFKEIDKSGIQLPELTLQEVNDWNEMLTTPAVSVYENNFSNMEDYDLDTLKKFAVFCRLLGFFNLDISDVKLIVRGKTMTIIVNEDHLVYSGSVEIKTW